MLINLKRTLGKKYLVVYDPQTDGTTPEFYIVPCKRGYIAPLNATELLVVLRAGRDNEIRKVLNQFPLVRQTQGLIAVAVLPSELPQIAYLLEPCEKKWLISSSEGKRVLPMPPSPKAVEARAA